MAPARVARPSSVKVGLVTYQIRWLTQEEWQLGNHDENAGGLTYHRQQYIAVQLLPGSQEITYQEILFHEIQHAVWGISMMSAYDFTAAASHDGDVEEAAIRMTTPIFMMVLRDNPEVFKYITSHGDYIHP